MAPYAEFTTRELNYSFDYIGLADNFISHLNFSDVLIELSNRI